MLVSNPCTSSKSITLYKIPQSCTQNDYGWKGGDQTEWQEISRCSMKCSTINHAVHATQAVKDS